MAGTNIQQINPGLWVQYLISAFPPSWTSDQSKMPGGVLYALFLACGGNLALASSEMVYAFNACRLQTATDTALDEVSADFFGTQLPRLPGESDSSFRARIQAALFVPYVTREAFDLAITNLTGTAPQLISPWLPGDTSAYDWSYFDVNLPGVIPGLYGDPGMNGQVGVIATLPNEPGFVSPVQWGYDEGAGYDVYTGAYTPGTVSSFPAANSLDALINRVRAAGIVVWRKYLPQALVNYIVALYFQALAGVYKWNQTVQPFDGPYWVVASAGWNTTVFVPSVQQTTYVLETGTAAPSGGLYVNSLAIPYTTIGSGVIYLNTGVTSTTVNFPTGRSGARIAVTPSWSTTVYISAQNSTQLTMVFGQQAPPGGTLSYYFLPDAQSATFDVPETATIFPAPFPNQTGNYELPFCTPSWNTQIAVQWQNGSILCKFNVPAPAGAFVHVGFASPPS